MANDADVTISVQQDSSMMQELAGDAKANAKAAGDGGGGGQGKYKGAKKASSLNAYIYTSAAIFG